MDERDMEEAEEAPVCLETIRTGLHHEFKNARELYFQGERILLSLKQKLLGGEDQEVMKDVRGQQLDSPSSISGTMSMLGEELSCLKAVLRDIEKLV